MTVQKINPDTLPRPHGYAQVMVATGGKLVFASGQVGIDLDENLVGSDYRSQAHRAALNAYAAVTAAGATPADVVRLTVYVVDPTPENLEELYAGFGKAGGEVGAKATAMSLIGVTALSVPGAVVEIEVTAVTD